ncbi:lysophospholipid acyltransferase family protein [Pacificibacter marinus]|uniref:Lipid A biosynthesis lauroyl acyltransferase n=1 Tax=Pacificibacter marinus TaxID=658057 RepID=A0A1Y5RLU3_9RHOB|nr:lysophospholipid acyltransferase family protein [Pacificibacter marinus]SEK17532.1 KDO2-lipid IV(A) lauroyltransferase [Pacificibacter marinus]SLN20359.1 Lipid A biosynthesis lauroyl acyltransferase [Pacificibacter marinus]
MKIKRGDIEGSLSDYIQSLALRGLFGTMRLLPFSLRLKLVGFVVSRIISPLAGYGERVRENLALVMPDLPEKEIKRLMRSVPASVGRTFAEIYSGADFKAHAKNAKITGAGIKDLEQAKERGQGVIFVSGHFGNYDVPRAVLSERGFKMGALYKPFTNPFFNAYNCKAISEISEPIFASKDRSDLAKMLRFLKSGGMMGILIDIHTSGAPHLDFFGKQAATATSAADMALKYGLALVPVYGIRHSDHGDYELVIEPPIPHSTAIEMTQALNDSIERQARAYMDQYFWVHRRWKAETRNRSNQ